MRRKKGRYENTFQLNGTGIDAFSEELGAELTKYRIERLNRIRVRLSLEEALLRYRDHFGETADFSVHIYSYFGKPVIEIGLKGNIFNPLGESKSNLSDWSSSILTSVGMAPQYSYSHGTNYLRITLQTKQVNPVLKLFISIAIGILLGLLGVHVAPDAVQDSIGDILLTPLFVARYRILLAMSGPVIFIMVITTMLNMGKITEQGGTGARVIAWYFIISFAIAYSSIAVGQILFHPHLVEEILDDETATGLFQQILNLIPNDMLSPLIEANTPQILLLAFVFGTALLYIGSRADQLTQFIKQCNLVAMKLTEWISRLVPYFAAILIFMQILNRTSLLGGLWKAFLLSLLLSGICFIAFTGYVAHNKKVSFVLLMKKLWKPFITVLRTGSLEESFGITEQCCSSELGIDRRFVEAVLPQGLVLFMPINVVGTLTLTIYLASCFEISVSTVWFVVAMILAVVLFVATPPVPGANLLAYIAIFAQLGIASEILIDAMIFDIVFGIFASAANQSLLQLEIIMQADRIGRLDKDLLRASH